jgi:hypothetical protein
MAQWGRRAIRAPSAPKAGQGERGQEAPSSDEVVGDVMSVMEAALSELRDLSASKPIDVVIDDASVATDSSEEAVLIGRCT